MFSFQVSPTCIFIVSAFSGLFDNDRSRYDRKTSQVSTQRFKSLNKQAINAMGPVDRRLIRGTSGDILRRETNRGMCSNELICPMRMQALGA
jgi:hypothetical protein